jgi:hypothetical protein
MAGAQPPCSVSSEEVVVAAIEILNRFVTLTTTTKII